MNATSYKGLTPSSATASAVGRGNRRLNTKPEISLRKALSRVGLRYRMHPASVQGTPDIAFMSARIAVFCDGDFWHGRDWNRRRANLATGANAAYWVSKIARNIQRDREVTRMLTEAGWHVIRIWESDIKTDAAGAANLIAKALKRRLLEKG